MQSVHTLLKLTLLRWTVQTTRLPDVRLPKKSLYGELFLTNNAQLTLQQLQKHKESLKKSDNNEYLYSLEDHKEDWQSC